MISAYDRAHIGELVQGQGSWFTAKLLRLIAEADPEHRARIALGFPEEVAAYEAWQRGDDPTPRDKEFHAGALGIPLIRQGEPT